MISSMTGFGRATVASDGREITIELKSVNHRYLDLAFRMPRHIGFIEDVLRQLLTEHLSRGHVDIFVNYRNTRTDARTVVIDEALMGAYLSAARKAAAQYELRDDITLSAAHIVRPPCAPQNMSCGKGDVVPQLCVSRM